MPFIVTTNRGCDDAECSPRCRNRKLSRRAVATLEEARAVVATITEAARPDRADILNAIVALRESGGTVGPLPDGTVIEVEAVTGGALALRAGFAIDAYGHCEASYAEVIAAYNARGGL
jgi:hypothetical protein